MFNIIYSDEAKQQLDQLQRIEKKKILKAIELFRQQGKLRNSRDLTDDLFEIKADNVRAYFKYYKGKIIIIGLIVLKKSQKAPSRFIDQAIRNIEKVIQEQTGATNMKTHKEIMNELKEKDPQLYDEIMNEVEEEKKKWGGKRANAGRKPIYTVKRIAYTKTISLDNVQKIKEYAKMQGISENQALDRIVSAGYNQLIKKVS